MHTVCGSLFEESVYVCVFEGVSKREKEEEIEMVSVCVVFHQM